MTKMYKIVVRSKVLSGRAMCTLFKKCDGSTSSSIHLWDRADIGSE